MKQKIFLSILITGLFVFIYACKSADSGEGSDEAQQLLKAINKAQLGVTTKVETKNIITKPSGDRFLITFKNPVFKISDTAYKGTTLFKKMKGTEFKFKVGEMTYLFGPKEKYLELVSMKKWMITIDISNTFQENRRPVEMKITISAEDVEYKNYNVSALLEPKARNFMELAFDYLKDSPQYHTQITNGKYDIRMMANRDSYISFLVEASKVAIEQKAMSEALLFIYKKGPVPDFKELAKKGKPIFDFDIEVKNLNMSVKKDLVEMGGASLADYSLTCSLNPDTDQTFLNFLLKDQMKGFKVRVPSKKEMEPFLNIKEVDSEFSLKRISPEFMVSIMALIKVGMRFDAQDVKQREDYDKLRMDVMQVGEKFLESKPEITFKLSPFKHHFGELTLQAQCLFNNSIIPEIKGEIKLMDVDATINRLKNEKLIPAEAVEKMAQGIKQAFIKNESGERIMTFEFKPPRSFFINGQPVNQQ